MTEAAEGLEVVRETEEHPLIHIPTHHSKTIKSFVAPASLEEHDARRLELRAQIDDLDDVLQGGYSKIESRKRKAKPLSPVMLELRRRRKDAVLELEFLSGWLRSWNLQEQELRLAKRGPNSLTGRTADGTEVTITRNNDGILEFQ
jgi:hypothetical protein